MTVDGGPSARNSRIPTIVGVVGAAVAAIAAVVTFGYQYQKDSQSLVTIKVTGARQSVTYPPAVEAEREKVGRLVGESWPPRIKGLEVGECKIEGYGKHDKIERVSCPPDPLRKWFEDRRFRRPEWLSFVEQGSVTIKNIGTKHLIKGSKLKLPALAGEYVLETGVDPAREFDREIELPQLDAGDSLTVRWWAGSSPTDRSSREQVPRISLPDGGNVNVFPETSDSSWGLLWLWVWLLTMGVVSGLYLFHSYAFNRGVTAQLALTRSETSSRNESAAKGTSDVNPVPPTDEPKVLTDGSEESPT